MQTQTASAAAAYASSLEDSTAIIRDGLPTDRFYPEVPTIAPMQMQTVLSVSSSCSPPNPIPDHPREDPLTRNGNMYNIPPKYAHLRLEKDSNAHADKRFTSKHPTHSRVPSPHPLCLPRQALQVRLPAAVEWQLGEGVHIPLHGDQQMGFRIVALFHTGAHFGLAGRG